MAPRRTTEIAGLFEALVEDLRLEMAAGVERALRDYDHRLSRIEKKLGLVAAEVALESGHAPRCCSLCEREVMARGLCSAHYQQWRYRDRKSKLLRQDLPVAERLFVSTEAIRSRVEN